MKLVISDSKTGKSYGVEVPKDKDAVLIGKKIGEKLEGGAFGAEGYELVITGGSDMAGFPMRRDVSGARRAGVILSSGTGYRTTGKGMRAKRFVRGNLISDQIMQVNAKVETAGPKALEELFPKAAGEKKEEKKK
ncbi:MAG: 30S ribosomal protein S6e [Candidatus Micrarchaeota archaeon]|nr:30S ribosomal protein S6e [Candidatus Micrarchaeota archaeon]